MVYGHSSMISHQMVMLRQGSAMNSMDDQSTSGQPDLPTRRPRPSTTSPIGQPTH
jgi:hypothetical protein